ncbi:hypothetical protein IJF91_02795 [Candidatus Saccharibacteria bacterium]|nr:hypothetical protein [Candidatus Saccharibacteria bacterium]
MVDEIKLRLMRRKPTLDDIANPNMSEEAKVVFRVAMKRSCQDQKKLLKQASNL